MDWVSISEFNQVQKINPIILLVVDETTKILLQSLNMCFQNFEKNCGPRSLITSSGRPWCLNTSHITRSTASWLVIDFVHGKKCVILVSRSTTMTIASKPFKTGRSGMKSKDIEFQGFSGMGSGWVSHKIGVEDSLIDNMYRSFEHTQRIDEGDATNIAEKLILKFCELQNVRPLVCHDNVVRLVVVGDH